MSEEEIKKIKKFKRGDIIQYTFTSEYEKAVIVSNNIKHESVALKSTYKNVASYEWLVDHDAIFISVSKAQKRKEKLDNIYTVLWAMTKELKKSSVKAWEWFVK